MSMDAFNVWHLVIIGGPLVLWIAAAAILETAPAPLPHLRPT